MELTVYWKMIECSCPISLFSDVGHSTALPNVVNIFLISVLDFGGSLYGDIFYSVNPHLWKDNVPVPFTTRSI
jgi:hypothetical protein